jgi:hypothetical protein
MAAALTLGLALRLFHYLRNPSVWHDEAALVLNVLGKSFAGLLGPLYFSEAAPPLFLWLEKALAGLLGDGTYALRLLPFLASGAALFTLAAAARRLLSPPAALWAVLLFGCSDRLVWHCCEAKPYALDVLAAAGLLFALTRTDAWPLPRQLALFSVLAPALIFLCYPACFLLGGLALSLLPAVVRGQSPRTWLRYGLFLAAVGGSFLLLWAGPVRAQRDETILQCWQDVFPCWDRPWTVPGWTVLRLLEVVRYSLEPTGNVLAVVAGVGAAGLWRAGRRRVVIFLLGPVALAGLAALLGQYPFGASRVMVFAAPGMLLLIAAGLPAAFTWLRRFGPLAPFLLAGVVLFPIAQAGYRVGWPWPRADAAGAAAFVAAHCRAGEAVVGTAWEHDYYFRRRRVTFWPLHPAAAEPPSAGGAERGAKARRLWLLASGKTARERRGYLEDLQASGAWAVRGQVEFHQTTVYYLERRTPPSGGPAIISGRYRSP